MRVAFRCLPAAFALLLLAAPVAAPAGPPPATAAGPIATRFEVYGFAGVHVLTLHSRTNEAGGRYSIVVDYATHGLASVFVDLQTRARVEGSLAAGAAQPSSYSRDTRRNGADQRSQVLYRPDGGIARASATPAPADPPPPPQLVGTVDNLTAYFRLERQLARTGSCALRERVFDGRHRYDLVFSDAGRQRLAPEGGQNFAGEAIACHMVRALRGVTGSAEDQEGARSGTIWYARLVPGDLLVPVRMQLDTQLGVVHGYLAELHGRGVNLPLME